MGFAPAQGNSSGGSGTIIVDPGDGTANVLSKFGLLSGTTIELFDSNVSDDGSTVTVDSDFEVTGLSSFDDVVTVNSSLIANEYIGQDDTELDISIGNISSGAGLNIVFSAGPAAGINNLQGGDFKFNPGLPTGAGARGKLKVLDGGTQKSIGLWHDGTNSHIENSAGQIQMGGPANTAATGTVLIQGNIADNPALVVEDSGNSGGGSNGIFKVINSVGTNIFAVSNFGYLYMGNTGGSELFEVHPSNAGIGVNLHSAMPILWNSSTSLNGSNDTGLIRSAAATIKLTNGSTGYGKLETGIIDYPTGALSLRSVGTEFLSGTPTSVNFPVATATLGKISTITGVLKFANSTNNNLTSFRAGVASGSVTYTWPTADGSSGQALTTDASGTLSWSAGIFGIVAKTANYTATASDFTITCDASGGAFTITLPAAASHTGRIYNIKNTGATGTVTIDANASETIDGSLTIAISTQYDNVQIQSNGTTWWRL